MFYKAELKLKTTFLLAASGAPADDRQQLKALQRPSIGVAKDGDEGSVREVLEVDDEDEAAMIANAKVREEFLRWANDPEHGPDSVFSRISNDNTRDSDGPRYLKVSSCFVSLSHSDRGHHCDLKGRYFAFRMHMRRGRAGQRPAGVSAIAIR